MPGLLRKTPLAGDHARDSFTNFESRNAFGWVLKREYLVQICMWPGDRQETVKLVWSWETGVAVSAIIILEGVTRHLFCLRGGELRGCFTVVGVWECGHGKVVMFCRWRNAIGVFLLVCWLRLLCELMVWMFVRQREGWRTLCAQMPLAKNVITSARGPKQWGVGSQCTIYKQQ